MTLRFVSGPPLEPRVTEGITALWADVVNAGGAVGFVPPVTREDVRPELLRYLNGMAEGSVRLVAGFDERGEVAATAFLTLNSHRLMRHWVWLYTVMVHPSLQGTGTGRELMAAAADAARDLEGVRGIRLTMRGGRGTERFYASCGYKEVGRVPDAIRVADGEYEDDVTMWMTLH
ncbi:N-acetyltransferase [Streptomyces armeniacus]|uniref:N-acetyltransferase n=1 Tax=Streptomyces armeniacus TaxID=83291 RepID=A0A345XN51_9ACTN|nr:GNAT family N-acetyltransferase [Streptomyces armeniacus]AXK33067.1 N-acetyltransferase [Streptomyces armeniacus]